MSYLILQDFKKQIQVDNLNQVIGNDTNVLNTAALTAIEEAASYLKQKYAIDSEFTGTTAYNPLVPYNAADRVYLDAVAYNPNIQYPALSLVLQYGNVYINLAGISVPEAFTLSHWVFLGVQYTLFYVSTPQPAFNLQNYYSVGDQVFYKNNVYTCQIASAYQSHYSYIQYPSTSDVPPPNIFPDDKINGEKYWGTGTPFTAPAGTLYSSPVNNYAPGYNSVTQAVYIATADNIVTVSLPGLIGRSIIQIIKEIKPLLFPQYTWDAGAGVLTLLNTSLANGESLFILNTDTPLTPTVTAWVQGDNRSQQMLTCIIDITLYHLHSRISPRNVPDLRIKRYQDAVNWLTMAMKGSITANLIPLQPKAGGRIRWGSQPKNVNVY